MSVERLAARALRRLIVFRFLGNVAEFFMRLFEVPSKFFYALSELAFLAELHEAHRYRLITGSDLGVGEGDSGRYSGMTPEAYQESLEQVTSRQDDDEEED